ncbi:MAG: TIGR01244 family sulfur transferase [Devosiaceae bacterium]|nr:TIGR01244 family sulfur transferase [Devosiaceae bacterium]
MDIRKISNRLSASPQICADDVIAIKEAGFVAIINNRPDGEEINQPLHDDIEEAAKRHGIPYHYLPVISAPYAPKVIAKMGDVLAQYEGPVLMFCRTGTRSTRLWAFSQKGLVPGEELISMAGDAGYDLSKLLGDLV